MKAVITGASSGIGMHIAKYLDSMGVSTVITARRADRLEILAKEMQCACVTETMDISKEENCIALFDRHKDADILVNCAGFGVFGEFLQTPLNRETELIDVNIKSLHVLTKLYLCEFEKKGSGYILNVSSLASFSPGPLFSSYYASKAYVTQLTRAIAFELEKKKSNVKISVFCPGSVDTDFNKTAGAKKYSTPPLDPAFAAKYAIDGMLKGKTVLVPGFRAKLLHAASKLLPAKFCMNTVYKSKIK